MPHLIYPLDAGFFAQHVQPALARSWRAKSFQPCQALCEQLLPRIREYHGTYHGLAETTLVELVGQGLTFDRPTWRALAGEMLLFAAADVPLLQLPLETLCSLLKPHAALIRQALFGSRDLTFAGTFYRPDFAGCNHPQDVARLLEFLQAIDPQTWQPHELAGLPELIDEEDRLEELAFARQAWPTLVEVYRRAGALRHVLICERERPVLRGTEGD